MKTTSSACQIKSKINLYMYTIVKTSGAKKLLATEAPAFILSLFLAESLYKFGSFTLECLAFLATWFIISFLVTTLFFSLDKRKNNPHL